MTSNQSAEEEDIRTKLKGEGLDPSCSEQEKITFLWRLYTKTEANLTASLETTKQLQVQQAEEMKEFENYVEHVKSLSTEREALTVEFAAENDNLKAENDVLRQEVESYKNDETRDMLLQQGLDDIAHSSSSEQIAYLLVERARLMDELEAEEGQHAVDTQDGPMTASQLLKLLEQERAEFEDELKQQRDSMNRTRENLKTGHEEECSALMVENEHIQDMLDRAKEKINKLETSNRHSATESSTEKSGNDLKRKLEELESSKEEELLSWKRRVRDAEHDSQTFKDDVDRLKLEIQKEKCRSQEQLCEYEESSKRMRVEMKAKEDEIRDLEMQIHKLTSEKKAMDLKMDYMEKELEDVQQREQDLVKKQRLLQRSDNDSHLKSDLDTLKREKRAVEEELDETKLALRKEKETIIDFEFKLTKEESIRKERDMDFERQEQLLRNKVKSLESQLSDMEDDLATSQNVARSARDSIKKDMETNLTMSETELRDVKVKLHEVTSQKEQLEEEVVRQREQITVSRTQVEVLTAQVTRLEGIKSRLDGENEDLTRKLQDTKRECFQKERDLLDERDKSKERSQDKEERLSRAHSDMDDLQREIRRVTSDLYSKQEQIAQLELRMDSEKAQSQSNVDSLRREIEALQKSHEAEIESLTQSLDKAFAENKKLRLTNSEKHKEIERLREDVSRIKSSPPDPNAVESDMAWLNKDIPSRSMALAEVRSELANLKGERSAATLIAETRADTAETKLFALQEQLLETRRRLGSSDDNISQVASLKTELRLKRDEVIQLKNQLQDEKFRKTAGTIVAGDVGEQLSALRQRELDLQKRNNELQHMLLDVETRLETVKTQTRSNADVRQEAEESKQSLQEKLSLLTMEVDSLRLELLKASDKHDQQLQKYSERKYRTKIKLQKARDLYNADKSKLKAEVERQDRELKLAKAQLAKELEWRDSLDDRHHSLLQEKRDLLTQISDQGEVVRDHGRQLSVLQVRCKFLEEENNTLQQRVDSLVRQKQNLDRIIKEYQFERHKEELQKILTLNTTVLLSPRSFVASINPDGLQTATSGLGNSVDFSSTSSTFNKNNTLEAIISPRVNNPNLQNFKGRLSQTMPAMTTCDGNDDTENDETFDM